MGGEVVAIPLKDYSDSDCCVIIFFVIFLLVLLSLIGCGCKKYYDTFANTSNEKSERNYNALYTSPNQNIRGSYLYTQPPGDTAAQNFGRSGQGTSGEFFPIQGRAAGTFMKNSSLDNLAIPSSRSGKIGGQDNYTTQEFSSRWVGFNNFGSPFSLQRGPAVENENFSNSYLINGGNQRVNNSGQKGKLPCQNWWPSVQRDSKGFCTQGSDAIVSCSSRNIDDCQDGNRFLKEKNEARWRKVI